MFVRLVRVSRLSSQRLFSNKVYVPARKSATLDQEPAGERIEIDSSLLEKLCRLTLIDENNRETCEKLEKMINYAKKIDRADTSDVERFTAVHYDFLMEQRKDEVQTEGTIRSKIIANAVLTKDNYYITPMAHPIDDPPLNDCTPIEIERKSEQ